MTTIILGCSGFIGTSISNIFSDYKKSIVKISSKEVNLLSNESSKNLENILSINASIIMCIGIKKQIGDNIENWIKNEIILKNFIKSLVKKPPKHLIYFSSASVYGEDTNFNDIISETTSVNLRSYYGISKFNSETILKKICNDYNIPLMCLRPPLIYGVNDLSKGYGPTLFTYRSLKKEPINLWGDGLEKREFIYVDDLAYLCKKILNRSLTGVVNTVSGTSYSYLDIIYTLQKLLGYKIEILNKNRTMEKVDHNFSIKLHKDLFPDFKYTNLRKGLEKLCSEIIKNENKYDY